MDYFNFDTVCFFPLRLTSFHYFTIFSDGPNCPFTCIYMYGVQNWAVLAGFFLWQLSGQTRSSNGRALAFHDPGVRLPTKATHREDICNDNREDRCDLSRKRQSGLLLDIWKTNKTWNWFKRKQNEDAYSSESSTGQVKSCNEKQRRFNNGVCKTARTSTPSFSPPPYNMRSLVRPASDRESECSSGNSYGPTHTTVSFCFFFCHHFWELVV